MNPFRSLRHFHLLFSLFILNVIITLIGSRQTIHFADKHISIGWKCHWWHLRSKLICSLMIWSKHFMFKIVAFAFNRKCLQLFTYLGGKKRMPWCCMPIWCRKWNFKFKCWNGHFAGENSWRQLWLIVKMTVSCLHFYFFYFAS